MKGFVGKTALAAAVIVGPIVGISASTADATPVWGGAYVVATPWWHDAEWSNLQIAQAFGPSNLYNRVEAVSVRGCQGCDAMAVNVQVDLVSYASGALNETNVATVDDRGNYDQNLAGSAIIAVASPGRVSLSGAGWAQIGSIAWQLRSLRLSGSTVVAVQGEINGLLGEIVQILEADTTTTTPAPALTPAPAVSPAVGAVTPAVAPAIAPAAATSGIQVTSNIQINT